MVGLILHPFTLFQWYPDLEAGYDQTLKNIAMRRGLEPHTLLRKQTLNHYTTVTTPALKIWICVFRMYYDIFLYWREGHDNVRDRQLCTDPGCPALCDIVVIPPD